MDPVESSKQVINKIIYGYITQRFEDGQCVSQTFRAVGEPEFTTPNGHNVPEVTNEMRRLSHPCSLHI